MNRKGAKNAKNKKRGRKEIFKIEPQRPRSRAGAWRRERGDKRGEERNLKKQGSR
jgi:hypothetical protein